MARIDRKQREFERREDDILDAALALLSQPNWESVTIEQIARSAEIGKGTIYKHFASKDELLFRMMMRFYQGLLVILSRENIDSENILQSFERIFVLAFRYHLEYRDYRYIVEYCNCIDFKERAEESWHASFLELDSAFGEWGDPMLLAAMDQGLICKRPLEDIRMGMQACFEGGVKMLWAGRDWCPHGDEQAIIKSVTEFLMAGLIGRK